MKEKKKLTLRQIATLAGTSKSTVSRVLTKHPSVSPDTRRRVEDVMKEHGYRPNLFARGLAGGRRGLIAVISRWLESGFFAEVIRGINDEAARYDGHLLNSLAHDDEDYIRLWHDFATGGLVDGVILIAPPLSLMKQPVDEDHVPVVLCACKPLANTSGWEEVDTVTVNNDKGMHDVLQHLMDKGCKRFVHMPGDPEVYDAVERIRAFQSFIKTHDGVDGEVMPFAHARGEGHDVAASYMSDDKMPDAFVAFNDAGAIGILQALSERAVSIPDQVSLSGFDDEEIAGILGLTTLSIPMLDLGKESGRLLIDRLEGQHPTQGARHSVMDMTLRVRQSTSPEMGRLRSPFPRQTK